MSDASPNGAATSDAAMTARPSTSERGAAAARLPDGIAFLGLGLIGGSIALALREGGYRGRITAWTPAGRGPAEAATRGIVDEAAPTLGDAVGEAGLIVLAGPPLAVLDAVTIENNPWMSELGDDVTVTDVASTKEWIVEIASARSLHFVGGHPMAGRETSGVEAATADLFAGRPWVVVPVEGPRASDVERVECLAVATGANPIRLDARAHDLAVAAISHLPLVVAAALVESVAGAASATSEWPLARELAASGWRDMTRLANGDPVMGADILATNADAVRERLQAMRAALDEWIEQLDGHAPDPDRIRERLERARDTLSGNSA